MKSDKAWARDGDPQTSHEAADTVDIQRDKRAVLLLLYFLGEARDSDIERNAWRTEHGTPQSLRSRRAELMRDGMVDVVDDDARSDSGRRCRRFGLTKSGMEEAVKLDGSVPFFLDQWYD